MLKISIIIPAYNEEKFIGTLLDKIYMIDMESLGFSKEIIVVDDGSTDSTYEIVSKYEWVKLISQSNQGKGSAVNKSIKYSKGDVILIQDADLEYDPNDYCNLLNEYMKNNDVAVYGSRPLGVTKRIGKKLPFVGKHEKQGIGPWIMNLILKIEMLLLYRVKITDMLTAYKLYPAKIIKSFSIETKGFETDHEITVKLLKKGIKIIEVPISYQPRSINDGKKIKSIDGLIAILTIIKYRFF